MALTGVLRDITERKAAEWALRASEERYRQIVERAQEGIWTIDAAGLTSLANPALAVMLGYEVDEMIGRPVFDFLPERQIPRARPIWVENRALYAGCSIGIVSYPEHGADPVTLLRRADVAMYMAKKGAADYAISDTDTDGGGGVW